MILTFSHVVKTVNETKSLKDRRFKITRLIASYIGSDGCEYRKSFEAKGEPKVPTNGTHDYLNSLKIQY